MAKTILITGGSQGIGAATALLAAQNGYRVCINYLQNEGLAQAVVDHIVQNGGDAFACRADVSDETEVLAMFGQIDQRFGHLSALVNNAGRVGTQSPLAEMSLERIRRMFEVNVFGPMLCAREAVRRMSTHNGGQGGAIVNIGSLASRFGSPNEYLDYASAKGAIDTFTIGLAKEVAQEGIRVNAVRPGFIQTDIHLQSGIPDRLGKKKPLVPLGRIGQPEEIAQAVLWLLSDAAAYTTGAVLDVSGGI